MGSDGWRSDDDRRRCLLEMQAWHTAVALQQLGTHLTIAAALTRAFNEGGMQAAAAIVEQVGAAALGREPWVPGCGRRAP